MILKEYIISYIIWRIIYPVCIYSNINKYETRGSKNLFIRSKLHVMQNRYHLSHKNMFSCAQQLLHSMLYNLHIVIPIKKNIQIAPFFLFWPCSCQEHFLYNLISFLFRIVFVYTSSYLDTSFHYIIPTLSIIFQLFLAQNRQSIKEQIL